MSCLRVIFTGTGAAVHPARSQSSLLVDTGSERIAVDYGCGAPRIGEARGVPLHTIDAFIITHLHYDHLCGVPHALFIGAFRRPSWKPIVAVPPGWEEAARRLLTAVPGGVEPRIAAHPRVARVGDVVLEYGPGLHTIEENQVLLEYNGIRILVSGDTRPTGWFREKARGAALAVHEATAPSWAQEKAEATGHSTVTEALAQVEEASMGALYHLTPDSEAEAAGLSGPPGFLLPEDGLVLRIC